MKVEMKKVIYYLSASMLLGCCVDNVDSMGRFSCDGGVRELKIPRERIYTVGNTTIGNMEIRVVGKTPVRINKFENNLLSLIFANSDKFIHFLDLQRELRRYYNHTVEQCNPEAINHYLSLLQHKLDNLGSNYLLAKAVLLRPERRDMNAPNGCVLKLKRPQCFRKVGDITIDKENAFLYRNGEAFFVPCKVIKILDRLEDGAIFLSDDHDVQLARIVLSAVHSGLHIREGKRGEYFFIWSEAVRQKVGNVEVFCDAKLNEYSLYKRGFFLKVPSTSCGIFKILGEAGERGMTEGELKRALEKDGFKSVEDNFSSRLESLRQILNHVDSSVQLCYDEGRYSIRERSCSQWLPSQFENRTESSSVYTSLSNTGNMYSAWQSHCMNNVNTHMGNNDGFSSLNMSPAAGGGLSCAAQSNYVNSLPVVSYESPQLVTRTSNEWYDNCPMAPQHDANEEYDINMCSPAAQLVEESSMNKADTVDIAAEMQLKLHTDADAYENVGAVAEEGVQLEAVSVQPNESALQETVSDENLLSLLTERMAVGDNIQKRNENVARAGRAYQKIANSGESVDVLLFTKVWKAGTIAGVNIKDLIKILNRNGVTYSEEQVRQRLAHIIQQLDETQCGVSVIERCTDGHGFVYTIRCTAIVGDRAASSITEEKQQAKEPDVVDSEEEDNNDTTSPSLTKNCHKRKVVQDEAETPLKKKRRQNLSLLYLFDSRDEDFSNHKTKQHNTAAACDAYCQIADIDNSRSLEVKIFGIIWGKKKSIHIDNLGEELERNDCGYVEHEVKEKVEHIRERLLAAKCGLALKEDNDKFSIVKNKDAACLVEDDDLTESPIIAPSKAGTPLLLDSANVRANSTTRVAPGRRQLSKKLLNNVLSTIYMLDQSFVTACHLSEFYKDVTENGIIDIVRAGNDPNIINFGFTISAENYDTLNKWKQEAYSSYKAEWTATKSSVFECIFTCFTGQRLAFVRAEDVLGFAINKKSSISEAQLVDIVGEINRDLHNVVRTDSNLISVGFLIQEKNRRTFELMFGKSSN